MSTSTDFNLTGAQIVEKAFSLAGIKSQEQPLEASELQDGLTSLNLMVKSWQAQGLHLWSKEEGILFITPGKTDYLLGDTGDKATSFDDYASSTLTVAAALLSTTLRVVTTTGMTAGDNIGIQLDNGTRQWTAIVSVDSATDLTITDPLVNTAAIGNTVFAYTNQVERPLRILGARRGTAGNSEEIEVTPFESRSHYFNQPNKSDQGTIIQYFYAPTLGNGRIYLWQTGQSINDFVRFTFERPLKDFDSSNDLSDFPIEWLEVLVYNLATRLGVEYNAPPSRLQRISAIADNLLDEALGFDTDLLHLEIQPDIS